MFLRLCCGALLIGALAGCASSGADDREWMKINEKYTGEDFRRDVKTCMTGSRLDDACMRAKGWVDVSRGKEAPNPFPERQLPQPPPRR
jgi:hypothetical protein